MRKSLVLLALLGFLGAMLGCGSRPTGEKASETRKSGPTKADMGGQKQPGAPEGK